MDTPLVVGLIILGLLLIIVVGLLMALLARRPADLAALITPLQVLTQAIGALQAELRGVAERVGILERGQAKVSDDVAAVSNRLIQTGTLAQGITDTAAAIREGLASAQELLGALRSQASARQDMERQTAESIRRLEAVIAGTQSRGAAGENILDLVLAQLPAEWQVRNFQIGNKTVEFGLRLPNNLILPIDSKWTSAGLLEQMADTSDPEEQQRLKSQIEKAVLAKAREVRKYIDPSTTASFGVAAVPDAVFDLCAAVRVEIMEMGVVLLSYSLFIPYLLLVYQTTLSTSHDLDLQRIGAYLQRTQESLIALQAELEGRLSKGITMVENSRDEMRLMASRAALGLTSVQLSSGAQPDEPQPLSD